MGRPEPPWPEADLWPLRVPHVDDRPSGHAVRVHGSYPQTELKNRMDSDSALAAPR